MIDSNYTGFKIQIYPNEEQLVYIKKAFGATRFLYNYTINLEEEAYKNGKGFLRFFDLNLILTKLKKQEQFSWMNEINVNTLRFAMKDCIKAYEKFFDKHTNRPIFKSKKSVYQQFYVNGDRLTIHEDYIIIPSLGKMQYSYTWNKNVYGYGYKLARGKVQSYYNPRVIYDGLNYYLTFAMLTNIEDGIDIASVINNNKPDTVSETIGIDLGIGESKWIVDSNGNRVCLPNVDKERKKLSRLHRKYNRQVNSSKTKRNKNRSNNSMKTLRDINKYYKRITNKKKAIIHDYVSHEIIARNPEAVVLESISAREWMKSTYDMDIPRYAKSARWRKIQNAMIYTVQNIIQYKCVHNNIPIIMADREFPSTQRCSRCGNIQKIGRKRVYKCNNCGLVIDRDLNSAYNLKMYPSFI